MCTMNSLDGIWQSLQLKKSLWSVLMLIVLVSSQGRSGASFDSRKFLAIQVQAPPDITIQLKGLQRCDTVFNILPASFSGQCSMNLDYETYSAFTQLSTNGGMMFFPTGVHKVYFHIEDDCRMVGLDSMNVTVYDAELPHVVCSPQQTVSLPENGFADLPATIFDGGSTDNCGHLYFKVKRMFPTNPYMCYSPGNDHNHFDDKIRFCCEDVDSSFITVLVRIYDLFPGHGPVGDSVLLGRFVDCMVQTVVKDKLPPGLTCPPNITISCGVDLDSLLAKGQLGIIDNCGIANTDTLDENLLDACNSGDFLRHYTVYDIHGQSSTCTQKIHVNKTHSFNGLDTNQLKWPSHKTVYACRIQLDTIQSGAPVIFDDACALVQVGWRDETYAFSQGGVCGKVLRYWTVIDWCQYNPKLQPNPKIPSNGYYYYVQEIKVMDSIPPVLIGVRDTVIGVQTPDCGPANVILPSVSATDCGSTSQIAIRYEVDYYSNGSVDRKGTGPAATGLFPMGRHRIQYFANDSCHNESSQSMIVEIVDRKPPSPLAMYGLSSSLTRMASGPMVQVPARLFNNKSTDNCTPESRLRFSFSSDINDSIRIYTCDSTLGRNTIQLFVWDEAGNSSDVFTYIVIDDIDSLCPSTIVNIDVAGAIATRNREWVSNVKVGVQTGGYSNYQMVDEFGRFLFSDIPSKGMVILDATCDNNYSEGISTADILKIQRHILGIAPFSDAEESIASDVDFSGTITTRDVVHIRNLILGKTSELPVHKSYVFLNPQYVFKDPTHPLAESIPSQDIRFYAPGKNQNLDILAVKLGDVNRSFTSHGINKVQNGSIELTYRQEQNKISVYLDRMRALDGFQIDFSFRDLCRWDIRTIRSLLPSWSELNYSLDGKKVRISYSQPEKIVWPSELPLFEIELENTTDNCNSYPEISAAFDNKLYTESKELNIEGIEYKKLTEGLTYNISNPSPNPFKEQTTLQIIASGPATLHYELYDAKAQLIHSGNYVIHSGINNWSWSRDSFDSDGVYILHIYESGSSHIVKLIVQ